MSFVSRTVALIAVVLSAVVALSACGSGDDDSVTVYSGRSESLVQPLLTQFEEETGIEALVRYASTSGTVALLLEEGDNSPADVVLLQDAGALGALEKEGMLRSLPSELLDRVDPRFRSRSGSWVGVSGRARTVVYNVEAVDPERDLPSSILDFTDPKWSGRIGWAPANGSFQAFVTALRVTMGDDAAVAWLEGIDANEPTSFPNNTSIVEAVGRGDVEVGFVNHYYLHRFLAEQGEGFGARNYYLKGDVGALVNVAGAGIIETTEARDSAEQFIEFLLTADAQRYFADETHEYPLAADVESAAGVPPIAELDPPDIDLSNLDDLRGTLDLMRSVGVLP